VSSERELAIRKTRQQIDNDLSESHLRAQLIARLQEIAQALPKPLELRAITIASEGNGGPSALAGFLASMWLLAQDTLKRPDKTDADKESS